MTEFISESEFGELKTAYRTGDVTISMPREVAKQFFLRITNAEVKQTTGRSIALKKASVWIMTIASPILFIISMISFISTHTAWESSLILPIAGICWTIIYGLTSAHGGWLVGTIPLAFCTLSVATSNSAISIGSLNDPFFLFVLSIWLQRTSFLVSDRWLMDITMSHFDAFEMMEQHLQIETN